MYVIAPCYCPRCRMDHSDIADSDGKQVFSPRRGYRFVVVCDPCYFHHMKPTTGQWQRYLDSKKARQHRLATLHFDNTGEKVIVRDAATETFTSTEVVEDIMSSLDGRMAEDLAAGEKSGTPELAPDPSTRRPRGVAKKGGKGNGK